MRPSGIIVLALSLPVGWAQGQAAAPQQPVASPWLTVPDPSSGDVTVVNTSRNALSISIQMPASQVEGNAPAQQVVSGVFHREFCGEGGTEVTPGTPRAAFLNPGEALCFPAQAAVTTYILAAGLNDPPGTAAVRVTVPAKPGVPVPPLAFVRDTGDAKAISVPCPAQGVMLSHQNRPGEQVCIERTELGVLSAFWRYSRYSPEGLPECSVPRRPPSVAAGVYTAQGQPDLKLTVRAPVEHAFASIMLGVVLATGLALWLTRFTALQQVRARLRLSGIDVAKLLGTGARQPVAQYHLNTTETELRKYLDPALLYLPPEHAEEILNAAVNWQALVQEHARLHTAVEKLVKRPGDFEDTRGVPFPVITHLEAVRDGNAPFSWLQSKPAPPAGPTGSRRVELHEAAQLVQMMREAARLAETLQGLSLATDQGRIATILKRLTDEAKKKTPRKPMAVPEIITDWKRERLALQRVLSDPIWPALTAEEFAAFQVRVTKARDMYDLATDKVLATYPPEKGGTLPFTAAYAPTTPLRETTLTRVEPLMTQGWRAALLGCIVAWLLASVAGLRTLYFTGGPWGETVMDYAEAFTYGAVTVAAVSSVAVLAGSLVPAAARALTKSAAGAATTPSPGGAGS